LALVGLVACPGPAPTPLEITTGQTLPDGMLDQAYRSEVAVDGGVAPYSFSVAGDFPAGLLLHSDSGAIDGTPSVAGHGRFVVAVTDHAGGSTSKLFTLNVLGPRLSISTSSLPAAHLNRAYSATLGATGGAPPLGWSTASGVLPPGVVLGLAGTLTGTPGAAGSYAFVARATDANAVTATAALSLDVLP
jgi:hypothetical protein